MNEILAPSDIERIAETLVRDFYKHGYPEFAPIDIERFATEYCGFALKYEKLSDSGRVLGVTSCRDTSLKLPRNGNMDIVMLPKKTLLIEQSLSENSRLRGRQRFSIAHECAHQLLFDIQKHKVQLCYRSYFNSENQHTLAQIKKLNAPDEYNANQLGAALLMPYGLMELVMYRFHPQGRLMLYGDYMTKTDKRMLCDIAAFLGVSKQALTIRLKELNMVDIRPQGDCLVADEAENYGGNRQHERATACGGDNQYE
ncbi:ImmA/IrrE family metallo-endopeptidase [Lachnospiraceae bacterium ZAX-1]